MIKVFISSRFGEEFEKLRELIVKRKFNAKKIVDIVALDYRSYTDHRNAKEISIEYTESSNIYLLILGETYGSCPEGEEKSYTHLEYITAKENNMPILIFRKGDEYKEYNDVSKIKDKKLANWVDEIYKDQSSPISEYFESTATTEYMYNFIEDSINTAIAVFGDKGIKAYSSKDKYYDENSLKEKIIKFFQDKNNPELLQKITLKYMPRQYSQPIPCEIDKNITLLFEYGAYEQSIPILCVLNEFIEYYAHPPILREAFHYFKEIKYQGIDYECKKNENVKNRSFLIEFVGQEENKFSICAWEHFNNEFIQIATNNESSNLVFNGSSHFDFDEQGIQKVFDSLGLVFNQPRYSDIDIYLEIILPFRYMSKGIKHWTYSGRRKPQRVIRQYKYVLRIQDRFEEMDMKWERQWKKVEQKLPLCKNESRWLSAIYNDDISDNEIAIFSETKIDDMEFVLEDICEFGVPIALLKQSENIEEEKYQVLCQERVECCKEEISTFICFNHNNDNSDMIFILDDPNHRPIHFKNSDENIYQ